MALPATRLFPALAATALGVAAACAVGTGAAPERRAAGTPTGETADVVVAQDGSGD